MGTKKRGGVGAVPGMVLAKEAGERRNIDNVIYKV